MVVAPQNLREDKKKGVIMKNLKFIKPFFVEELDENLTSGKFIIQPLERGYGITIGNALRRILLSSLPGAAIVNVKIEGVEQEFTTIPGVYEDVMTIILNLKKIVFKVDDESDDFEEQLEINLTGPKKLPLLVLNYLLALQSLTPNITLLLFQITLTFI